MELSSFLVNKSFKSFEQRSYQYRVITTEWFVRPAPSRWQDLHCWMRSWRWWVWKGKGSARGEPLWKNTNKGGTSENTLHQKTRNQNYTIRQSKISRSIRIRPKGWKIAVNEIVKNGLMHRSERWINIHVQLYKQSVGSTQQYPVGISACMLCWCEQMEPVSALHKPNVTTSRIASP